MIIFKEFPHVVLICDINQFMIIIIKVLATILIRFDSFSFKLLPLFIVVCYFTMAVSALKLYFLFMGIKIITHFLTQLLRNLLVLAIL